MNLTRCRGVEDDDATGIVGELTVDRLCNKTKVNILFRVSASDTAKASLTTPIFDDRFSRALQASKFSMYSRSKLELNGG